MSAAHRDEPRARENIAKLISQIEELTKLLTSNGTRAPPQEDEKKDKNSIQQEMQSVRSIPQEHRFLLGDREKFQE